MYCRKCGAVLKDSAKFCDSCGSEVIKVEQRSYAQKDIERMEKHRDEKNPYIGAALFASVLALILAIVPWNYFGDGIGTSLPMRIVIVVFALLGDYHVTKAKQVNNLIYSKYGFRIKANIVSLANCLSIFVTVIGLFALFTL